MKTKRCNRCNQIKPVKEFNLLIRRGAERRKRCKACEYDLQKSRGLKIPQEGGEYQINTITMRNHMYIHFGWWESRMTSIERDQGRRDVKKYYKPEIKPEHKRDR